MRAQRQWVEGFARIYSNSAVIFTTVVVLLLLINLICWASYGIPTYLERLGKRSWEVKGKQYEEKLQVLYPDLSRQEVTELRKETRRLWQQYEEFTQFREAPKKSRFVNVDRSGFRPVGEQGPWPPPKEAYVVFVFGGSTTFGYGVADHQTIPSYLQVDLKRLTKADVMVYNFGRAYYFSAQERVLLEKLLMEGHVPDLAIFIDGVNEMFYARSDALFYTDRLSKFMAEGDVYAEREMLKRIPPVKALQYYFGETGTGSRVRNSDGQGDESTGAATARKVLTRYQRNKKLADAVLDAFGIGSVFVWQPFARYEYDPRFNTYQDYDYDSIYPHAREIYDTMRQQSSKPGFKENFLWLASIQRDMKRPLYVSGVHYTAEMCELIASHIARSVLERKLIKKHPVRSATGSRPLRSKTQ